MTLKILAKLDFFLGGGVIPLHPIRHYLIKIVIYKDLKEFFQEKKTVASVIHFFLPAQKSSE